MYCVYDGNKPASVKGYPTLKGKGWDTHCFHTFEEAHIYALNWLGSYGEGVVLELNTPYNYSFCEIPCFIEIRTE
jgi:hypothetical protein